MILGAWDHAKSFLWWLFDAWDEDTPIRFYAERDKERRIRWACDWNDVDMVTEELLDLNEQGWTVFVQPNPCWDVRRAEGRDWGGRETNVAYVHVLMLDWDVGKRRMNLSIIQALQHKAGLPIHALIRSGTGQHAYYRLAKKYPVAEAKETAIRMCDAWLSDAVGNSNRLMRLPGTVNWKQDGQPLPCYVEKLRPPRDYWRPLTLEEINARLDNINAPRVPPRIPHIVGAQEPEHAVHDVRAVLASLPEHIQYGITFGTLPPGWTDRSKFDFAACCALVSVGLTNAQIADVYAGTQLAQIKAAEQGTGYLSRTVKAARVAVAQTVLYLPENLQRLVENPNDFWYLTDDGGVVYDAAASRESIYQRYLSRANADNAPNTAWHLPGND